MDNIRQFVRKTSPPQLVRQTLRTTLLMPPVAARATIAEMTKPTKKQKRWVKKIKRESWKGVIIAPNLRKYDEETALIHLKNADIVIFKIHGGGFRVGNAVMYMETFINWIEEIKTRHNMNAVILSIEYGLAPKHTYPAPVLECVEAYKYVTETLCIPASKIVLSGDSAGGAMVLETLIRTYAPGLLFDADSPRENTRIDLPAGMLLVSPLVTPGCSSKSWQEFEKTDLVSFGLRKLVYKEFLDCKRVDVDSLPIVHLTERLQRGFDRFAPKQAMVFVGEKEVFRDDVLALAETVQADGYCQVHIHSENYEHDWYFIREIVKQKDRPMLKRHDQRFADFAVQAVKEATLQSRHEINETLLPAPEQVVSKILQDITPPPALTTHPALTSEIVVP
ncbi:hypothetical protein EC973_004681 [Apophysomyces ossiformis]|uniref:Alpha/beta hydrolase fold-3 domain-containing protein n=1 Tax=Apophysomyces ossiformis TaxID=679940 RepID=A0A8H7EPS0_9FUNG|nr:hypothetical protein EC973_004681 [Apophysomyces ossiformis]